MIRATLTITFWLCTASYAQSPPSYGFGTGKCAAYISDVKQRGDMARALYFSWAQGFITATNALMQKIDVPIVPNFTAKIPRETQQKLLDELCQAKPDQEFSKAALELLDKLRVADGLQPVLK
jgi:hypothetical protein